jgi:hypothetical protein
MRERPSRVEHWITGPEEAWAVARALAGSPAIRAWLAGQTRASQSLEVANPGRVGAERQRLKPQKRVDPT